MNILRITLIVLIGHAIAMNAMENNLINLIRTIENPGNAFKAEEICRQGLYSYKAIQLARSKRKEFKLAIASNQPEEPEYVADIPEVTENWKKEIFITDLKTIISILEENSRKNKS